MSKFEAPLTKFELKGHPNADSLSIAIVGGWQCVVKTEGIKNDTLGVYVPLDAIVPADHKLLGFLEGRRVKTCKLRGALSQGILLPYSEVLNYLTNDLKLSEEEIRDLTVEGTDFAPILGIKRWEDTGAPLALGADHESPTDGFEKYTDIENIKNYTNVIPLGEYVEITEKLHGTSARFGIYKGKLVLGSRNRQLKLLSSKESLWHRILKKYDLATKLLTLQMEYSKTLSIPEVDVGIYGEIVGPNIQDLKYGCTEPTLYVYDIVVNGKYVAPVCCRDLCEELGLTKVPTVKWGPLTEEDFDLRLGASTLDASHVREGIVIKPCVPQWDSRLGRVILKVISEDYLMRKGAKDSRDV